MKIQASPQARGADARKIIRTIPDILDKSETVALIYGQRLTTAMYVRSNAKLENMRVARGASFVRISGQADNILAARDR